MTISPSPEMISLSARIASETLADEGAVLAQLIAGACLDDTTRARIAKRVDIKAIRAARGMSQDQFSKTYRLPLGTLRDWEQHRREPDTGSRLYLAMIEADPDGVQKIISKV